MSNIFSATPKGVPNLLSTSNSQHAKTPSFRIAEDKQVSPFKPASVSQKPAPSKHTTEEPLAIADSGYYGSQFQDAAATEVDQIMEDVEIAHPASPEQADPEPQHRAEIYETPKTQRISLTLADRSVERESRSATRQIETERVSSTTKAGAMDIGADADVEIVSASSPVQLLSADSPPESLLKPSPTMLRPVGLENLDLPPPSEAITSEPNNEMDDDNDDTADVTRSPSEGSSPIRPLVRKSSLNFASLPAREPLTSNKSLGGRMSRVSHLDQTRTSFYPRLTGGKSLGVRQDAMEDEDAMDIDEDDTHDKEKESAFANHSKTYTQRLQDQISMLGKSQAGAPRSKSIPAIPGAQQPATNTQSEVPQQPQTILGTQAESPRLPLSARTPGAFPSEDEEDWIAPPTAKQMPPQSPRPQIEKSFSADIMEGVFGKGTVSSVDFDMSNEPSHGVKQDHLIGSPIRNFQGAQETATLPGSSKTASTPEFSRFRTTEKTLEANPINTIISTKHSVELSVDASLAEAPGSPTKTIRDSPVKSNALKQVKDKFSSILKGSKGLLASGAALSAEGKASLVDLPSTVIPQKEDNDYCSAEPAAMEKESEPSYPDLSKHLSSETQPTSSSSIKTNSKRTRASIEREKREQKQKDKEEKEAQHRADQMDKLEKARERERERARHFNKEQEKVAAERQIAAQKELERTATRTPAPKDLSKQIKTSPRKAMAQTKVESTTAVEEPGLERAEPDLDMIDIPTSKAAPPSIPRPTAIQSLKTREIKRPIKPIKDTSIKTKQAPTLIRVNTFSQNSGFHPSNSVLATTLQDTLGGSQQQPKSKSGQASVQAKPSLASLKSSTSSTTGRPKALELAAKRKQQEEKEAQRRRDIKAEMERKREEDRRLEEERREKERQKAVAEAEAKKIAERQMAIEKAKATRAPPPAVRSQLNGPPEYGNVREKAAIPRPPSRLQQSMAHRSQEDLGRPVSVLGDSSKMATKRPLQQDGADDGSQRAAATRTGMPQQKEVKRMRLSDEFSLEEEMEIQSYGTNLKGPPVRPSAGFKKVSVCLPLLGFYFFFLLTKDTGFAQQVCPFQWIYSGFFKCDQGYLQGARRASPY